MLTVRVPKSIEDRLDRLARGTGRLQDFFVMEALLRYLNDVEDTELAERTLERVREGRERIYTSEELERLQAAED